MDLKGIMIKSQTYTIWSPLQMESKKQNKQKFKLIVQRTNCLVATGGGNSGVDKMAEGSQKVQISSYKISSGI